ncbi:MAG: class SAM-dependent methyltransferase [Sphingobacteriaceae bacterium]|jgi:SAM-dependent methyltransferase|nr:class SAM-dependent methyltransferase [Sphingobacteriaceae bacterium]
MKDNFSKQAEIYSKFRPGYPEELFRYIATLVKEKNVAWDCATGNGQAATELANYFDRVYATDISEKQLANAVDKPNITYIKESAENSSFDDDQFDLITVAQAIHWFNFDAFYKEVKRTLKPAGIIAVIGYGMLQGDDQINREIDYFYKDVTGPYWDAERRYLDEAYQTIPFPFKEIYAPQFVSKYNWTLEQLLGYLNTWSAVQHYIKQHGHNPVEEVEKRLNEHWRPGESRIMEFPILLRIGVVE